MKKPIIALGVLLALQVGCAQSETSSVPTPPPPPAPTTEAYSVGLGEASSQTHEASSADLDPIGGLIQQIESGQLVRQSRQTSLETIPKVASSASASVVTSHERLSRLFLVEQPSAGVSTAMLQAFAHDPPGGLVFWNASNVGASELAQTISRYSRVLKENGHLPALFAIDYEGGGLGMSPSGKHIAGIQRFRKGFTDLVHGIWLGRSMKKYGTELCSLHGRIMGIELAAAGVNYPLTLVADLAQKLFTVRGVSTDSAEVASCLSAFTESMAAAGPVIAVTKHYPGLGQNVGDTHDVVSVSSAKSSAESDKHLAPFRDLIQFANDRGLETRLSIMSSHGKFPLIDPDKLTTESSRLLQDILRDQFAFQGIRVSDAMWMGGYGEMTGDALYAVYLNSFNAGMDLLMIPGNRYGGALKAFQAVMDGSPSRSLRAAIELRSGVSFEQFQSRFHERVRESLARIDMTLQSLPYPHESIAHINGGGAVRPSELSRRERTRYYQILEGVDRRWKEYFSPQFSSDLR